LRAIFPWTQADLPFLWVRGRDLTRGSVGSINSEDSLSYTYDPDEIVFFRARDMLMTGRFCNARLCFISGVIDAYCDSVHVSRSPAKA